MVSSSLAFRFVACSDSRLPLRAAAFSFSASCFSVFSCTHSSERHMVQLSVLPRKWAGLAAPAASLCLRSHSRLLCEQHCVSQRALHDAQLLQHCNELALTASQLCPV